MPKPAAHDEAATAARILREGGVVAFPTETVYGLGADAANPEAVRRVFAIKGRPATNPLIVHVPDAAAARRCVAEWPEPAQRLAERFWPGALTIVLGKSEAIAMETTAGGPTVGVRVPDHPLALEMLRAFAAAGGVGVAAPSANRSSHVSPTTAEHVREDLGDAVDMILDGGPCGVGIESTVLSLATGAPTVLRPGGVSVEALREVLGEVQVLGGSDTGIAASPGRQSRHYAPRAQVIAFPTTERGSVPGGEPEIALMALSPLDLPQPKVWGESVAMPNNPQRYAEHFYGILRLLDGPRVRQIWVELPPDEPRWLAVRDRILRAAGS